MNLVKQAILDIVRRAGYSITKIQNAPAPAVTDAREPPSIFPQIERSLTVAETEGARKLQDREAEPTQSSSTSDNATLPSILFVSMPKSGTVFTRSMLARGLSLEQELSIGVAYFPHDLVEIPKLMSFCKGGKVATTHFDPSPHNFQLLKPFINRWVLHIRDPRSVVLSWVHHMNRLYSERENGEHQALRVYPTPPEAYYHWLFRIQVDWTIENFLPSVVSWLRSWLAIYDFAPI